jgi:hypothetical protein
MYECRMGYWMSISRAKRKEAQMSNSAMREALKNLVDRTSEYIKECNPSIAGGCEIRRALENAKDALAAPPRNCEVGTAEEQQIRFNSFCAKHLERVIGLDRMVCRPDCPLKDGNSSCELAWAQMPYEAKPEKKGE